MDGLGQTKLEDLCLKAAIEEVLNLETKHVVELHLVLFKDAVADEATEQRITLKQTLGALKSKISPLPPCMTIQPHA